MLIVWAPAILGRDSKYLYLRCGMIPDSTPVCMHCPTIDIMPTCPSPLPERAETANSWLCCLASDIQFPAYVQCTYLL